jgi:RNase P subunit RPR2
MSVRTLPIIGLILFASAVAIAIPLPASVGISIAAGAGSLLIWMIWNDRPRHKISDDFSDPGYSVEVDCRACGQFNRVPSHRLRDRPKCGRCKARLMPGKRVVVCRVSSMEGVIRAELDALWKDEDRLWQCLADHVTLQAKAKAEERDPRSRMVN